MKKRNLKLLQLNKKSISNLEIRGGAPISKTHIECEAAPSEPVGPSEETFARMCATTILTTYCPSALCY